MREPLVLLLVALTAAPSAALAQARPAGTLIGSWELAEAPTGAGFERGGTGGVAFEPCDAGAAQRRLLRMLWQPGQRFTLSRNDSALVLETGGGPLLLYTDGRTATLQFGRLGTEYRMTGDERRAFAVDYRPEFGGVIREVYTLASSDSVLELELTVEHGSLRQPVRQHAIYRRASELPVSSGERPAAAGQVADTAFRPPVENPAFAADSGPLVLIDEAHANFHTATGRYLPMAELLRRDGYVVTGSPERLTEDVLRRAGVLVVANATKPLEATEVSAVRDWVRQGGALLLITDHPPFVEAATGLASVFGVRLRNAGAADLEGQAGALVFRRADGTLKEHAITRGIDQVATFAGSSFEIEEGVPLLEFGPTACSLAHALDPNPQPLVGSAQGAAIQFGDGRVAVFAEAAMFSAQVSGPNRSPMGMNAPMAKQNARFVLNVLHWLSGLN